jgi:PST family polysaccharide transporter
LLALFRDAGLGVSAVQAPHLERTQLDTLFWSHLGLGFLLTAPTLVLAPVAARFYAEDAVRPVLLTMSCAFIFIGAGGFARVQLERGARFAEISRLESAGAVIGTAAMIGTALYGGGAYSFVAYLLVSEMIATALAWRYLRWKPTGKPRWSALRPLLSTGFHVTAYQSLIHVLQQIDGILVGRFFGPYAMGLYGRANQLLALPNLYAAAPLNQVALVTLSRMGSASSHFGPHARTTATLIAHLILPLFAVCAVLPDETVRLVLGSQWPEAAPLLRLLSIAAAASTLTSLAYAVNVAMGQTRRLVISAAAALPLTLLAVWLGSRNGTVGVAFSIAVVNVLLLLPRLWWSLRGIPGGLREYLSGLWGPFAMTLLFAAGLSSGRFLFQESDPALRLLASVATGVVFGAVLAIAWSRVRNEWRLVFNSLPLPRPRAAKNVSV